MREDSTYDHYKSLIDHFNQRIEGGFVEVYKMMYRELFLYSSKFFANTNVSAEDVIQDIFCSLWENHNAKFDSVNKIKAFLYVSIKNRYRTYIEHDKIDQKYVSAITPSTSESSIDVAESELYVNIIEFVETLSDDNANIFRLYAQGYTTQEIAEKLGKSTQTVYNKKNMVISMLRNKFVRFILIQIWMLPQCFDI